MSHATTYVGLDVHKRDIAVAMLVAGSSQVVEWTIGNEPRAVRRLARKLERESAGGIECAYEAGACGYTLQRQLRAEGISCRVVAPSLIPKKPGQQIKTDRRDARKLAELLRAGLLTEVHPPTPEEESARDLCRCRLDAQADLTRARQRLLAAARKRGFLAVSACRSHSRSARLPSSSSASMSLTDLGHREPAGEPRDLPPASLAEVDSGSLGGSRRLGRRPGGTPVRHAVPPAEWFEVHYLALAARWLGSRASAVAGLSLGMQSPAALRALVALVRFPAVGPPSGS